MQNLRSHSLRIMWLQRLANECDQRDVSLHERSSHYAASVLSGLFFSLFSFVCLPFVMCQALFSLPVATSSHRIGIVCSHSLQVPLTWNKQRQDACSLGTMKLQPRERQTFSRSKGKRRRLCASAGHETVGFTRALKKKERDGQLIQVRFLLLVFSLSKLSTFLCYLID